MPHAHVNGQRIAYDDTGSGNDAIVFSHGFFMDRTMFAPQVEALSDRWRCISWDERGHGETEAAADSFTYWDSASDLLALLDHLGVERAVLVGMSQGGYLSLRAALLAPKRIMALVLIDTQQAPDAPETAAGYDQLVLEGWLAPGGPAPEIRRQLADIIVGAGAPGGSRWIEAATSIPEATVRQIYETLATRDDLTDRMGELTMPALVVHGSEDLAIGIEKGRALADLLPNSEFVEVEGGGHAANLTHPAEVNAAITRFLDGVGSR